MKVKEEIKKSGTFWLPFFPEPVPGVLSISNERRVELEVTKSLVNDPASLISSFINLDSFFQVIGHIQEYGFVILDGCQISTSGFNFNLSQIQTSQTIWANRVFTGFPHIQYLQNGVPSFNTFKFSIEGIDEWVWIHAIKSDYKHEERTTTISCKPPESIPFNLTKGMRLEIIFEFNTGGTESQSPWEVGITQKTYFRLVSKNAQKLNVFISVAQKIIDLLCFAINEQVSLDSMSVTSDAICQHIGDDTTYPAMIDIYDSSVFYAKDQPRINRDEMLFRFKDIRDNAERIINRWIESYEQYKDAFNLYFLAQLRLQPSYTTRFLSLAQCLEVYHRKTYDDKYMEDDEFKKLRKDLIKQIPKKDRNWFGQRLKYAHELTLRDRIRKMVEPFEEFIGKESVPQLIDYIVNTRHYLTHYNSDLESRAAKGENLYILCLKMEMLFELCVLRLMGFSQERINSIRRLQWKRSLTFLDAEARGEESTEQSTEVPQDDPE